MPQCFKNLLSSVAISASMRKGGISENQRVLDKNHRRLQSSFPFYLTSGHLYPVFLILALKDPAAGSPDISLSLK